MINKLISLIMLFGLASSALANKYTTVIIDPGHGGKDRGAKWGGVSEAYLNLKVAKKVETLLKAKNIPVRMTRRSDVFLSLSQRTTMANKYKNAIFLGTVIKGKRHGKGVMKYRNGRQYEGFWEHDLRDGKGFERYPNGNTYFGQFKYGKAHGKGVYTWKNGEVYDGEWNQGVK